jgi:hypothetical protein
MFQYVVGVCALACPLSMALMMLLMRKRHRGSAAAEEDKRARGDGRTD